MSGYIEGESANLYDQSGDYVGVKSLSGKEQRVATLTAAQAANGATNAVGAIQLNPQVTSAAAISNSAVLQTLVNAAKVSPVVAHFVAGTFYFSDQFIDVDGVTSMNLKADGDVVFDRLAPTAATPYFSNSAVSVLGFGKITVEGPFSFKGHWNRSVGFRGNFGADVAYAGAAFKLYGVSGSELRIKGTKFYGLKDLPFVVYGADLVEAEGCYFERCRDIGAVDVKSVRIHNNRIVFSEDNGISASRGCGDVHIHNNTVIGANSGIWCSKYITSEAASLAARRLHIHDNTLICCMTGLHQDGASKNFSNHDNHILWTGFHTTGDNEVGFGAGTFVDTTIGSDATAGSNTLVLADASKLSTGDHFLVHPSKRSSPRVYKAALVAGNTVTTVDPLDEDYTAAHAIRVTKCEAVTSGVTGYPILIAGASSLFSERGMVHHNSIHGWTGKAAIWLDRCRAVQADRNIITKPLGLVSGDGIVRGIYVTDGGSTATQTQRVSVDDNDIDMSGALSGIKKRGVEYSYGGTISRGGPVSPNGNRITGVLRGNESQIPAPQVAAPANRFYDQFNELVTTPFVDPIIPASGKLALFDFGQAATLDVGAVLTNGQVVSDILGTTATATIVTSGAATARHLVDSRCLELIASGSDTAYLNLGTDLGINATTNRQFVVIVWVTFLSLNSSSSDEGTAFLSLSNGASGRALQMRTYDNGSAGPMSFWWDNRGFSPQPSSLGSTVRYTNHQYAISYTQSGANATATAYRDGVQDGGPHVVADISMFAASSTVRVGAGCAVGSTSASSMRVHRVYFEDLAASGGVPLTIVANDYAANRGRFNS